MPRPAMSHRRDWFRRGFTLVEMLVVISIVGLLAGLLIRVTSQALRRGRLAAVESEISQLQNAMTDAKTKFGTVPPSLGGPIEDTTPLAFPAETLAQRQARIMRFLARAFPAYVPDPSIAPYTDWQQRMAYATLWTPNFANDNLAGAGNLADWVDPGKNCCNVDTLDPAEMLVLWLGGIPRRRQVAVGQFQFETTGFSADPAAPFRMAVTRQEWNSGHASWQQQGLVDNQRTPRLFDFQGGRLLDNDGDGWPEYYPDLSATVRSPFVFFSSQDYPFRPAYPYFNDLSATTASVPGNDALTSVSELTLMARWGLAKPFASRVTASNGTYNAWDVAWVQPEGFQIVCSGLDGVYGGRPTFTGDTAVPAITESYADVRVYPDGVLVRANGAAVQRIALPQTGDQDNLTNFTTGRLEDTLTGVK